MGTSGVGSDRVCNFHSHNMSSTLGCRAQGFGSQAISNIGSNGNMYLGGVHGYMQVNAMMPKAKPGKHMHRQGRRSVGGFGPLGNMAGPRRFGTHCHCYAHISMAIKIEVLQAILPEVWNPVTMASKTIQDIDSCLALGFDRWPWSPVETTMATGLA